MIIHDEIPKCSVCGTSQSDDVNYLNTKMKLLISKCGHRFCDQCIKREFQHKREISCPLCGKGIRKSQLQDKTLEELAYTKELSVRKKVLKDYNKIEEDFDTMEEYNDYLEQVENIVYDIVSGTDEEKALAHQKWKEYRQENQISIATNDAKRAEEERRIEQLIEEQQRAVEERRLLQHKEDAQYEADLEVVKAQRMEVALGERDEKDVMELRKTTTAIPIDQPITAEMQAAMMGFQPGVIGGPQPQPIPGGKKGSKQIATMDSKKLRKLQQKAGGYDPQTHFHRNLHEAWNGLLWKKTSMNISNTIPTPMEIDPVN